MPLRVLLRSDLKEARQANDPEMVSLIRTLIAAIDNAEAVDVQSAAGATGPGEVPRRTLSDNEIMAAALLGRLDSTVGESRTSSPIHLSRAVES